MAKADNAGAGDDRATDQRLFVDSWQVYRKMVDNDYLFHRGAYGALRRVLETLGRPFGFLDVACGDVSMSAGALRGLQVLRYHGLDISAQALSLAVRNLEDLPCDTSFHRCDFAKRLERWSEPVDVAWIGLSLHHFQARGKAAVMRSIRNRLEPGGLLMIYEDASPDGESRDRWLRAE